MSVKQITIALALCTVTLSACGIGGPSDQDGGIDSTPLEAMTAGIWIDGNGCDHWIIDDGFEGYMTPRFGDDGKPVCRKGSVPYTIVDFDRSLMGL